MKKLTYNDLYKAGYKNEIPLSVTIELLTKCNFNCVHCYIPEHTHEGIPKEELFKLFKDLKELGTLDLNLTGGEIFLRTDIIEIIRKAREMGFRVTLLTNASLISEEIAKELQKLRINSCSITLFSMNNDVNDRITGISESWNMVMNSINILKNFDVNIELKTPILKDNVKDFVDVNKFCDENNFEFSASPALFPRTDGDKTPMSYLVEGTSLFECIENLDGIIPYKINDVKRKDLCFLNKYSMFIDSYGNVYPCTQFFFKLGNIKKSRIDSIWKGEKAKKIRNLEREMKNECEVCSLIEYCNFCPGIAYLENNDYNTCTKQFKAFAEIRYELYKKEVN